MGIDAKIYSTDLGYSEREPWLGADDVVVALKLMLGPSVTVE